MLPAGIEKQPEPGESPQVWRATLSARKARHARFALTENGLQMRRLAELPSGRPRTLCGKQTIFSLHCDDATECDYIQRRTLHIATAKIDSAGSSMTQQSSLTVVSASRESWTNKHWSTQAPSREIWRSSNAGFVRSEHTGASGGRASWLSRGRTGNAGETSQWYPPIVPFLGSNPRRILLCARARTLAYVKSPFLSTRWLVNSSIPSTCIIINAVFV